MTSDNRALARWNIAAAACVGTALMLVLALTGWGAYVDFADVRTTLFQGEINRFRSHAVRTVGRIQDHLVVNDSTSVEPLKQDPWLRQHWERALSTDRSRLYAAVVDRYGTVEMHSVAEREGLQRENGWYQRMISEAGDDVVETCSPALSGGVRAYDIHIPIIFHEVEIGTYHSGLNPEWFEEALAEKNVQLRKRWAAIFALMLLVVVVAAVSLDRIIRRSLALRKEIEVARVRQFVELGELAAGIAHEVRNPVNAIRLNLHALKQLQVSARPDRDGEAAKAIAEANREIGRVEELIRIMLGYARPENPQNEDIDAHAEVEAVVDFLKPVFDGCAMHVAVHSAGPARVRIDRNRFRQTMLNLLRNARDALGHDGRIDVHVTCRRGMVEISVVDNGPGVSAAEREQVFDPFYSTKESGTGLGLALARRFVEEAAGSIRCEANEGGGAAFRIMLPEVPAGKELDKWS